ncbi:S41 family peptidase [Streptomyces sp. NPDC048172]|uniref:S41 family peptidase n=1 Tax=Streptomyces sp. NPDC048172 TaxID=3365505 RepID=UPI003712E1DF
MRLRSVPVPDTRRAGGILAVALAATTVLTLTGHAAPARADAATGPPRVDGVWRTDGYGTAVVIDGRRLRTYDTTAVSCLPGELGGPRSGGGPGGARTYRGPEGIALSVRPQGRDRARLAIASSVGARTLHRVGALPKRCGKKPSDDPRAVFDTFWQTYAENYPFFTAKGIDWRAVRDHFRPKVTRHTTDDQLFRILRRMIEPLHDAHTALDGGEGRQFEGIREDTEPPTRETLERIDKATAEAVGVPQRHWGQGAISFAELPGGTGYLRLTRFIGYAKGDYPAHVAELDRALDAVFTRDRVRTLRGLIVDVRFNGGGSDELAQRVQARLTDRPYLAYRKHARNDPRDPRAFTRAESVTVRPHRGPVFTGPVAVLTGRLTVSAGETFTQGLMGRSPAAVRVGENTQGVFSDTMGRALPNGWTATLPNEEYLTRDGRTFDGAGIPPDHRTPVFTEEEFREHRDSALTRARALLSAERPASPTPGARTSPPAGR